MTPDRSTLTRWNHAIQRSIDEYHRRPTVACLEEDCWTPRPGERPLCTFHARGAVA